MHKGISGRFSFLLLKIFRKVGICILLSSAVMTYSGVYGFKSSGIAFGQGNANNSAGALGGLDPKVVEEKNVLGDVPTDNDQGLKSFDISKVNSLLKVNEFNRMPPVLDSRPVQNILISKEGIQVVEEDEAATNNPVGSMPYFSSNVENITVYKGPLVISSRGTEFDNTHSAQGRALSLEVSKIFQQGLNDESILKKQELPSQIFYFGNGSVKLTRNVRKGLNKLVNLYNQNGGGVLRVVGHASQRTRDMSYTDHVKVNFALSLTRARVVSEFLINRGIPSVAIILEAKGARYPEYLEMMPAGEAKNRRVEVYLE